MVVKIYHTFEMLPVLSVLNIVISSLIISQKNLLLVALHA